jgi:hypothetical protein
MPRLTFRHIADGRFRRYFSDSFAAHATTLYFSRRWLITPLLAAAFAFSWLLADEFSASALSFADITSRHYASCFRRQRFRISPHFRRHARC